MITRWFESEIFHRILLLTVLGAFSLTPWPWVAFPAALLLLAYFPGCTVAQLLGFRFQAHLGIFVLLSMGLSLSLSPVALDVLWRWTHHRGLLAAAWWAVSVFLIVLSHSVAVPPAFPPGGLFTEGRNRKLFAGLACWVCLCIVGSHWPSQWRDAPLPASPRDYIKHHAVLWSLEQHSLPLSSPFYAEESGGPYYYYHYFYLLPATARLWGNNLTSAALAHGTFAALVAVTVLGLVVLLTKSVMGGCSLGKGVARNHCSQSSGTRNGEFEGLFAAGCLALVGGLDAIPALYRWHTQGIATVQLDAWVPTPWRIHNFFTQALWGPQHVLPLVTLLTAVWLLRFIPRWRGWLALGPLMGASIFGSSVYFAMALFPAVILWCLVEVAYAREGRWKLAGGFVGIAVLGIALMAVQAMGYLEMNQRLGTTLVVQWERYPYSLLGRFLPGAFLANVVDLPWILVLEYGVRILACIGVGALVWRELWKNAGGRLLIISSGVGLLMFLIFRSGVHSYDYGFKIGLLPSMALTSMLVGGLVRVQGFGNRNAETPKQSLSAAAGNAEIEQRARNRVQGSGFRVQISGFRICRIIIIGAVVIGLPVGLYEAPAMALRRFLELNPYASEARAIEFVREKLPVDAVIQVDPVRRMETVQLLNRRVGVMQPDNAEVNVFRPRDFAAFQTAFADIQRAAETPSAKEAAELFSRHGVTHVFVGSVERSRWAHLEKFQDPTYFDVAYEDSEATVYVLPHRLHTQPE